MPYANVPGDTPDSNGVRLQWAKDSHLQLTVLPMLSGHPEEAARDAALWSTLDRHGVNHLIRRLREARDDVFGADA